MPAQPRLLDFRILQGRLIHWPAAGMQWAGGFPWQIGEYGDTCVFIFFGLSGYVIACVADKKELGWRTYAANRASRLWSSGICLLVRLNLDEHVPVCEVPSEYGRRG